jgi:hypothetical protein
MGVAEPTILQTLAYVRGKHGGVASYLEGHGLPAGRLTALREALL